MEKREITVVGTDGPQVTVGWVGKGLAVTPYYEGGGEFTHARLSITHVPTGYGVFVGLRPKDFQRFVEAVWLADVEWGDEWVKKEIYGQMPYKGMWLAAKLAWLIAYFLNGGWIWC